MKMLSFGAAVAAMTLAGHAVAGEVTGPTILTDPQMESIVAGVGANNVATAPWTALRNARGGDGFTLNHNLNSDAAQGHAPFEGVAVPSAVPNSFCFGFCPL
jgi:hypothetical protein